MYFKLALFTPSINHPLHPPTLSHPTLTFLLFPFPVEFSLCDPVNLESGACCGMWSIYVCVWVTSLKKTNSSLSQQRSNAYSSSAGSGISCPPSPLLCWLFCLAGA